MVIGDVQVAGKGDSWVPHNRKAWEEGFDNLNFADAKPEGKGTCPDCGSPTVDGQHLLKLCVSPKGVYRKHHVSERKLKP